MSDQLDKFILSSLKNTIESPLSTGDSLDSVWAKAYPEISKIYRKKKRRRAIIIFFFGLFSLALIGLYINHSLNTDTTATDSILLADKTSSQNIESNNNSNVIDINTSISDNTLTHSTHQTEKTTSLSSTTKNTNFISKEQTYAANSESVGKTVKTPIQNNHRESNISQSIHPTITVEVEETKHLKESRTQSILAQQKANTQTSITDDLLPIKHHSTLLASKNLNFIKTTPPELIASINYTPSMWELSLGHSRFSGKPLTTIQPNQLSDSKNIFFLKTQYTSVNLKISRSLNHSFSVSSGFHFLNQYMNLGIQLSDAIYDENKNGLKGILGQTARNLYPINNRILDDSKPTTDQLYIKFLPNSDVINGDTLRILANAPINIQIHHVPIQLNYHITKNRLEWIAFGGLSINFIELSIPELPISIYKDGNLVSKDINFKGIKETIRIPNIILGGGVKYHITQKVNASLMYNINPADTKFARYQFWVGYRM